MNALLDTRQVVVGIIWRNDDILLVQQQESYEPIPVWTLPGGGVEKGEMLHTALKREIFEETGLKIIFPIQLAYIVEGNSSIGNHQLLVYAFEIRAWNGELSSANDPDNSVRHASFINRDVAIQKIESDSFITRRDPIIAYLRKSTIPGSFWAYARQPNGQTQLVHYPPQR